MSRGVQIFKQSDVTKACKGAVQAGLDVQRVEIDRAGKIVVFAGKSADPQTDQPVERMGRHQMKMPKYTQAFVDRHGNARFYFRKAGSKQVPLPGLPWSPQFMAAYEAALEGPAPRVEIGASRTKPGTINALVVSYFNSMAFQSLAPETRRTRRNILERFRAEHGDKRSALLKREHVNVMFAKKAATRFAARNWLKTVRALMQFAVAEGLLAADPTAGIKNLSGKTDGFRTWNEDDIAAFEARHPIGTRERLALALLVNTAQRRGDVVRMGRQHIRQTQNGPSST